MYITKDVTKIFKDSTKVSILSPVTLHPARHHCMLKVCVVCDVIKK